MSERDVPRNPPGLRGLKRHPALVALSRDHHHALVQALFLKRAGQAASAQDAAAAVRGFLAFYEGDLRGHFADEEEVLLPRTRQADEAGASRILAEHRELEALVAALRAAADPRGPAGELGQLIDDHVRFEERAYFQALQDRMAEADLAALGEALEAHRRARGVLPGCALPGGSAR